MRGGYRWCCKPRSAEVGKGNGLGVMFQRKKKKNLSCIARISEDWISEHVEGNTRDISLNSAEWLFSPELGISVSCIMEDLES